jgi:hypothetical protein
VSLGSFSCVSFSSYVINAGQVEGSNNNGRTPGDIVINPAGIARTNTPSGVAEAMLYEGNLDTVDIPAMEA